MQRALQSHSKYVPVLVLLTLIVGLQSILIDHEGGSAPLTTPRVTQRSRFINEKPLDEVGSSPPIPRHGKPATRSERRLTGSPFSMGARPEGPSAKPKAPDGTGTEAAIAHPAPDSVSVSRLREEIIESGRSPTLSMVGVTRRVEAAKPPVVAAVPEPDLTYHVRRGDSLWKIARRFNLRVQDLKEHNKLSSSRVHPGTSLEIPRVERSGLSLYPQAGTHWVYVTEGGESLVELAMKLEIPLVNLVQDNDVSDLYHIQAGRHLKVRVSAEPEPRARKEKRDDSWQLPVRGRVGSKFGWRRHPIFGEMKFHAGIDIPARKGQPIRAARRGKVIFAGWSGGYGYRIDIRHPDGLVTRYAHCSKLLKRKGDRVEQSELIARVGSTGISTGPHMHFEVRRRGKALDPMKVLSRARS